MNSQKTSPADKHFREQDKKNAVAEHEKEKRAIQAKTERLRALRLAKEAEDRAEAAKSPNKPRKKAVRKKLPAFEKE
ncbi:MAG: hypothetical protein VX640_11970 [Pseudomonadota bacterium]|nr:hypothetical protein [Pseudomonadota bacterium]